MTIVIKHEGVAYKQTPTAYYRGTQRIEWRDLPWAVKYLFAEQNAGEALL